MKDCAPNIFIDRLPSVPVEKWKFRPPEVSEFVLIPDLEKNSLIIRKLLIYLRWS